LKKTASMLFIGRD